MKHRPEIDVVYHVGAPLRRDSLDGEGRKRRGRQADSIQDFIFSELLGFFIETFINTFMASAWPLIWYSRMGFSAVYWAVGGYFVWAFLLAIALSKREKQMRKDLGLG